MKQKKSLKQLLESAADSEVTVNESKQQWSISKHRVTHMNGYFHKSVYESQDQGINGKIVTHGIARTEIEAEANAQRIVTAVNNYDDMLEALKAIAARLNGELDNPALLAYGEMSDSESDDILGYAEAAIAKATNSK